MFDKVKDDAYSLSSEYFFAIAEADAAVERAVAITAADIRGAESTTPKSFKQNKIKIVTIGKKTSLKTEHK